MPLIEDLSGAPDTSIRLVAITFEVICGLESEVVHVTFPVQNNL